MNKRALLILLFASVAILGVVAGYFVYIYRPEPTIKQLSFDKTPLPTLTQTANEQSSVKVQNDTTNWKVYQNEELGFELKYPPDFQLFDDPSEFPPNRYGDYTVILEKPTKSDEAFFTSSVAVKKLRTSLKKAIASQFDWGVRSVRKDGSSFFIDYYPSGACSISQSFVRFKDGPTGPGGEGEGTTDVLVARVVTMDGCSTASTPPELQIVHTIIGTIQFIAK